MQGIFVSVCVCVCLCVKLCTYASDIRMCSIQLLIRLIDL